MHKSFCFRRYNEEKAERDQQRTAWRQRHRHRKGKRGDPYPENLQEFPSFALWLEDDVQAAEEAGIQLEDSVKDTSIPPKFQCMKFRSMWAFGAHFRVASFERSLQTCDCGVAATFIRPWRSNARDRNPVEANIEYLGQVEEIVELDYRRTCVVVLVCRWVRANYRGPNASVKRDKWGFTLANFQSCKPCNKDSFAFPKHCQQVFYSDAPEALGWRVVLRTEVRGRRVDNSTPETEASMLFARGRDTDHDGLRPPHDISEQIPACPATTRDFQREVVFTQGNGARYDRELTEKCLN